MMAGDLPAQFQGDRGQIPRRRLGDLAADRGRSGEQEMVERKLGEGFGQLLIPDHDRQFLFGKIRATSSRSRSAKRGVSSEGLIITRLPAASAPMAGPRDSCRG